MQVESLQSLLTSEDDQARIEGVQQLVKASYKLRILSHYSTL